jgi:acyl-CoA thioesterase I
MIHRLLLISLLCLPPIAMAGPPAVLVLGDSLSAGYGIATADAWVTLLQERIAERGLPHRVINASVSGETTAGGLTRLPALLDAHQPAVLVIALGANDGLRGIGLGVVRENLGNMVRLGRKSGSEVLLIGVRLPPNYGVAYTDGFQAGFGRVAADLGIPLAPSLLAGVDEDWSLMQPDGLHPTAAAQGRILENVWPTLEPLLLATANQDGPRHRRTAGSDRRSQSD